MLCWLQCLLWLRLLLRQCLRWQLLPLSLPHLSPLMLPVAFA
jgi:hypothetical protein